MAALFVKLISSDKEKLLKKIESIDSKYSMMNSEKPFNYEVKQNNNEYGIVVDNIATTINLRSLSDLTVRIYEERVTITSKKLPVANTAELFVDKQTKPILLPEKVKIEYAGKSRAGEIVIRTLFDSENLPEGKDLVDFIYLNLLKLNAFRFHQNTAQIIFKLMCKNKELLKQNRLMWDTEFKAFIKMYESELGFTKESVDNLAYNIKQAELNRLIYKGNKELYNIKKKLIDLGVSSEMQRISKSSGNKITGYNDLITTSENIPQIHNASDLISTSIALERVEALVDMIGFSTKKNIELVNKMKTSIIRIKLLINPITNIDDKYVEQALKLFYLANKEPKAGS
jgi:hypothetical protein